MIAHIAWGLARSPRPEHRWRRIALPLAAMVALLTVQAGISVLYLIGREAARVEDRLALIDPVLAPTDLWVQNAYDDWRGVQFGAIWIGPAGDAPPVLPPGLDRLPKPGEAAVSPALDLLIRREPELARRYPNRFVLGTEGLRSGGELLVYLRLPPNHATTGNGLFRITAFGPPAPGMPYYELGTNIYDIPRRESLIGITGFVVFPALLVLVAGVAAASSLRDRRFATLQAMGTSGRTMLRLAVTETLLLALPGLLVAWLVWAVAAPRMTWLPFVGRTVVRGDLALPLPVSLVLLGGMTAATALAAIAVAALRHRRGAARPRPSVDRTALSLGRVVPFGLALGLGLLGTVTDGATSRRLIYAGLAASIVAVPLLMPFVVRVIGTELRRSRSVPALLAGRQLEWDTVRVSRPFAAFGALVVLVLIATAYIATYTHEEPPPFPRQGPSAALVSWRDARADDLARLGAALGSGFVAPLTQVVPDPATGDDDQMLSEIGSPALLVGAPCERITAVLAITGCGADRPYELPPGASDQIAALVPGGHMWTVRLTDPASFPSDDPDTGQALVIWAEPAAVLHERLGTAAMLTLVAPSINDWQLYVDRPSPLAPWLTGAIRSGLSLLALACVVSLVDRLLATREPRRHLLNLGLTPRRLATLDAWLFAVPYAAIGFASLIAGLISVWAYVTVTATPMPWGGVGLIVAIGTAVGLLGSLGVAVLGARDCAREGLRRPATGVRD